MGPCFSISEHSSAPLRSMHPRQSEKCENFERKESVMLADVHHLVKILLRIAADCVSLKELDLMHFLLARSGDVRLMAITGTTPLGLIAVLWRYPVNSMRGEELDV